MPAGTGSDLAPDEPAVTTMGIVFSVLWLGGIAQLKFETCSDMVTGGFSGFSEHLCTYLADDI